MSFDIGIDFRATSGYVSDPANCTYCLADAYPTTRGGATFGISSGSIITNDVNNTFDARIAGMNYHSGGAVTFQLDLPASGSVDVRAAVRQYSVYGGTVVVKDNTTTLFTVNCNAGSADGDYRDALDVDYSPANWPGSNSANTKTFATTTLKAVLTAVTSYVNIAHLRVTQAAAAVALPPPMIINQTALMRAAMY